MSTHSSTKINQKEYLKKYLSGDTNKKKKKGKKHKKDTAKVKIIDDDAHTTQLDVDEELLLGGEDAPQIVGTYIEENPIGCSTVPKWKSIVIKDEDDEEDVKPRVNGEDLFGPKSCTDRIKDEFSPKRRRKSLSTDLEPQRRNCQDDRIETVRRRRSRSPERKKSTRKSPVPRKSHSPGKNRTEVTPTRGNTSRRYGSPDRNSSKTKHLDQACRRSLSSDQSPPRRRKKDSLADQSPPRRKGIGRLTGQSPQRRRKDSTEQSPPRRRKYSTDQSPPRRRKKDSSDHSPPRRRKRDLSPVRKHASSRSPLRIKREKLSPDLSPIRKYKSRILKQEQGSPEPPPERLRSRWEPREPSRSLSPPPSHKHKAMTKTLDGKRAGLQNAEDLQKETLEMRRREDEMYANMSTELSGRDAEVQVRETGRRGRRAREAQELNPEEQLRKEAHERKKKELYDRWGKGLTQIEAHRSKVESEQYESSKPLARYSNDADLEQHLRDQERADDPMLEYMRKKHKDRVKQANVPTMPTYKGSFPENRFGIRPGYRWDGVDRSNGYEKKWFDKQNEKLAVQDEAYKYSVEDM